MLILSSASSGPARLQTGNHSASDAVFDGWNRSCSDGWKRSDHGRCQVDGLRDGVQQMRLVTPSSSSDSPICEGLSMEESLYEGFMVRSCTHCIVAHFGCNTWPEWRKVLDGLRMASGLPVDRVSFTASSLNLTYIALRVDHASLLLSAQFVPRSFLGASLYPPICLQPPQARTQHPMSLIAPAYAARYHHVSKRAQTTRMSHPMPEG